jgi:iron donor protein CyaY
MLEKNFLQACEAALLKLFQMTEELDQNSSLDVDYADGILKIINIANKKTFVINRNSGNQKIWYSSPITGADYFSYSNESQKWLNEKNIELSEKLLNELKNFF